MSTLPTDARIAVVYQGHVYCLPTSIPVICCNLATLAATVRSFACISHQVLLPRAPSFLIPRALNRARSDRQPDSVAALSQQEPADL